MTRGLGMVAGSTAFDLFVSRGISSIIAAFFAACRGYRAPMNGQDTISAPFSAAALCRVGNGKRSGTLSMVKRVLRRKKRPPEGGLSECASQLDEAKGCLAAIAHEAKAREAKEHHCPCRRLRNCGNSRREASNLDGVLTALSIAEAGADTQLGIKAKRSQQRGLGSVEPEHNA